MFWLQKTSERFEAFIEKQMQLRGQYHEDKYEFFSSLNGNFLSLEFRQDMSYWEIHHIFRLEKIYKQITWWNEFNIHVGKLRNQFISNPPDQVVMKKILMHCFMENLQIPENWLQMASLVENIKNYQLLPPPLFCRQSFDPDFIFYSTRAATRFNLTFKDYKEKYNTGYAMQRLDRRQQVARRCFVFSFMVENQGLEGICEKIRQAEQGQHKVLQWFEQYYSYYSRHFKKIQEEKDSLFFLEYFKRFYHLYRRCPSLDCRGKTAITYNPFHKNIQGLIKNLPNNRTHEMTITTWYGPSNLTANPDQDWLDFQIVFTEQGILQINNLSQQLVRKLPFLTRYMQVDHKMIDSSDSSSQEQPCQKKVRPVVLTKQTGKKYVNTNKQVYLKYDIGSSDNQHVEKQYVEIPPTEHPVIFKPPNPNIRSFRVKYEPQQNIVCQVSNKTVVKLTQKNIGIPSNPPAYKTKQPLGGFIGLYRFSTTRPQAYCEECDCQFGLKPGSTHLRHKKHDNCYSVKRYTSLVDHDFLEEIEIVQIKQSQWKCKTKIEYEQIIINEQPQPQYIARLNEDKAPIQLAVVVGFGVFSKCAIAKGTYFGYIGGEILVKDTTKTMFTKQSTWRPFKDRCVTFMQTATQLSFCRSLSPNCDPIEVIHHDKTAYAIVLKATKDIGFDEQIMIAWK